MKSTLSLVLAFLMATPVLASEPIAVDLSQAIDMALQRNESYQIAWKEVSKADGAIMEAVAGALPQFTAGLTYLRNWEIPIGVFTMGGETTTFRFGTKHNYTADLTVTQPIYIGGKTFTAIRIAGLAKHLAHENLRQSQQELKVQVYNGFYGALLAREVLRVNQESQKLAEDNLDVVQKMYNQGMAAEYDLLRARVAVANLQPAVIKAANDAEVAMSALKNLLGVELGSELSIKADQDSIPFVLPPIDADTAKIELQENRPEIRISDLSQSVSKQLISIATAGYKPTLIFSTSLQYQRPYDRGNPFSAHWTRSITSVFSLSVPIFDSWKTPSQVKQARIDYAESTLRDQAIHKAMILDFEQSLGRYLEARKRLSAQGDAVELARRGLTIANVRFESGVGTQLEVADARLSLSMAEINKAVAFHDLAISYASVMRALGRDISAVN